MPFSFVLIVEIKSRRNFGVAKNDLALFKPGYF
jgi:hypothetical protein